MRRLDYLHGLGVTAIWLMPFQTFARPRRWLRCCPTTTASIPFRHAGRFRRVYPCGKATRHPRPDRSRRQSHVERTSLVSSRRGAIRIRNIATGMSGPTKRPANANSGMVFPGVQKSTWTYDRRSQGLVFPSLLRFSARSEYIEPRGPGRNPEDHGILDPTGRLRFSHGRGSLRDLDERAEGDEAGRAV